MRVEGVGVGAVRDRYVLGGWGDMQSISLWLCRPRRWIYVTCVVPGIRIRKDLLPFQVVAIQAFASECAQSKTHTGSWRSDGLV